MSEFHRRKIAYYSINDPLDKRSWSGITYYLGQNLQKNIGDVDFLGPVRIPWLLDKTIRALQKTSRFFLGSEWIPKYSLLKNMYAAIVLKRRMKGKKYDFVMAPAAASELAYLNTDLPVIYFGDATYKVYSETYEKEFRNMGAITRWEGEHLEKRALRKSSVVIFSSKWAARSALQDYGVPTEKIEVIQMGANIEVTPEASVIFRKKQNPILTLLFLSVDWERKGGPIAFDALKALVAQGWKVKMIVCGCVPPAQYAHPDLQVIPFLNKNKPEDFARFVELLSSAHFLLLPTRADCTPLVNCESNAYGVPVITTDVGGITDSVIDGLNGYCLPYEAEGKEYAGVIASIFSDPARYDRMVADSRKRYDEELNWETFCNHFRQVLQKHGL